MMGIRIVLGICAVVSMSCAPSSVEETGYLVAGEVGYTSENTLDVNEDTTVVVVGRPGAIAVLGGELEVFNDRNEATNRVTVGADASGSFVITTSAAVGDTLELVYTVDDGISRMQLRVADDLTSLPAPGCINCVSLGVSPPSDAGIVTVALAELELADGMVVVFNQNRGVSNAVSTSAERVEIAGEVGDPVCAYEVDARGNQSPTSCTTVPES